MKRKILILSVLAICIATLAAGTIAFFTAEGKAHNVITTGGVEIAVQEWADDEKTKPFENLSGVMPNTTVTKIAEVENDRSVRRMGTGKSGEEHQASGRGYAGYRAGGADAQHHRLDGKRRLLLL